jgi:hypothetical protein
MAQKVGVLAFDCLQTVGTAAVVHQLDTAVALLILMVDGGNDGMRA